MGTTITDSDESRGPTSENFWIVTKNIRVAAHFPALLKSAIKFNFKNIFNYD